MVAQHRVTAHLGLLRVQNPRREIQQPQLPAALVVVEQLIGEEVRIAEPEVELLQPGLPLDDAHGIGQGGVTDHWGRQRLGGAVDQQQEANGILLAAGHSNTDLFAFTAAVHGGQPRLGRASPED